jgi:hypothetical protein
MKTMPVYSAGQPVAGTSYVVVGHLGSGGMGDVYEVEDVSVGRHYVLKTLNGLLARRPEYADQMRKEGRTLAQLRHPNIVEVITAGRTADAYGLPFIVMERLEGATVKAILGSVAFPFESVWQIGTELLDALYHMHHPGPKDGRGPIIHRDIKPENIFLAKNHEGRYVTKLLDLGIAILVDGEKQSIHGTPKYMAPEQLRGEVSPQTDLYQVGCVLFEMLAGRHPFAGARTEADWIDAHLAREAPRLRAFVDVPKRVDEILDAALSKEPARRPRDARAFMVALQELKARAGDVGVLANTTVEDLHTAIEKQTDTGYEAYATAENTIEGFTAPGALGNGTLEDAFPSFAVGVTVTAPGQRESAPPPADLIAQMSAAQRVGARRGVDRSAETRSARLPARREPRERDPETEELLAGLMRPASTRRASASPVAEPTREPAAREVEARTPSAPVATPLPAAQIARVRETASLASPRHDDGKTRDARVLVTALVVGALVAGGATLGLTRRAAHSQLTASTPTPSTPSASASHGSSASSVVSVSASATATATAAAPATATATAAAAAAAAAPAPAPVRPSGPPARTPPASATAAAPRASKPKVTPTPLPPPADTFAPPERDISF